VPQSSLQQALVQELLVQHKPCCTNCIKLCYGPAHWHASSHSSSTLSHLLVCLVQPAHATGLQQKCAPGRTAKTHTHSSSTQSHVTNWTQLQKSGLLQCCVRVIGGYSSRCPHIGWVARLAPVTAAGGCCLRPAPSSQSVHTVCLCLLQVHQQSSHEGASWSPQLSLPALSSNGGSTSSISTRAPHSSQLHTTSLSRTVITAA
jgi:hypothetical protein